MNCPCPTPVLLATAKQIGYWQCDVGNSSKSNWVEFQWPFSAILEQAFCSGWSSVDFRRGGNDYRVTFKESQSRLQEACNGRPCDAEQAGPGGSGVNQLTNAKRPVRRWPSLQEKQSWEALQIQQAQQHWSHWTCAEWAWLLDVDDAPPASKHPPRRSYTMESYFQDDFWPYILKNWPMDAERKKTKAVGGMRQDSADAGVESPRRVRPVCRDAAVPILHSFVMQAAASASAAGRQEARPEQRA
eukprot:symbB.v1.2.030891.t1/scaffold3527.1/size54684/4